MESPSPPRGVVKRHAPPWTGPCAALFREELRGWPRGQVSWLMGVCAHAHALAAASSRTSDPLGSHVPVTSLRSELPDHSGGTAVDSHDTSLFTLSGTRAVCRSLRVFLVASCAVRVHGLEDGLGGVEHAQARVADQ